VGKRAPDFPRHPSDLYDTPAAAVSPLLPFLKDIDTFAEPCAGNGHLVKHLEQLGLQCVYAGDILDGYDALELQLHNLEGAQAVITNPPWKRPIMHKLIEHFLTLAPAWLLIDADWAHTLQAGAYMPHCTHIVSIGRVRWIAGSANDGKDNSSWYRFGREHQTGPHFYGREKDAA
jgi:hypothetical protein